MISFCARVMKLRGYSIMQIYKVEFGARKLIMGSTISYTTSIVEIGEFRVTTIMEVPREIIYMLFRDELTSAIAGGLHIKFTQFKVDGQCKKELVSYIGNDILESILHYEDRLTIMSRKGSNIDYHQKIVNLTHEYNSDVVSSRPIKGCRIVS